MYIYSYGLTMHETYACLITYYYYVELNICLLICLLVYVND